MQTFHSFNLSQHNTLGVPSVCPHFFQPTTIEELQNAYNECQGNFYILGEGSNTLFVDENSPNIIRPLFTGKSVALKGDCVLLTASSGENWHQLVKYCVDNKYYGIENLALIPGSVGAAPVQNIGAYGVELADVVHAISWYDFEKQQLIELSHADCQFAYRDSIFKHALQGKGVITAVTLKLSTTFTPVLTYAGLNVTEEQLTAKQLMQRVIDIRNSKLPDPNALANAGSFFKNPVVEKDLFDTLKAQFPKIPAYFTDENTYKLAAGWLIEQAGFKGFQENGVGMHKHQALVLVNYHQATGRVIVELAKQVIAAVKQKFDVTLEPEVRFVDQFGLTTINEC